MYVLTSSIRPNRENAPTAVSFAVSVHLPAAAGCSFEGLLPIHPQNVEWDQSTKCSQASLFPKSVKREEWNRLREFLSDLYIIFIFFFRTKPANTASQPIPVYGQCHHTSPSPRAVMGPQQWQLRAAAGVRKRGININHPHSSSLRRGSSYHPNFTVPLFKNHWRKKIIKNRGCSHARTENGEMQMQHTDPIWAFVPSSVKQHLLTLVNK